MKEIGEGKNKMGGNKKKKREQTINKTRKGKGNEKGEEEKQEQ